MATQKQRAELSKLALRYGRAALNLKALEHNTNKAAEQYDHTSDEVAKLAYKEDKYRAAVTLLSYGLLERSLEIARQEVASGEKTKRKRAKHGK